jgi:hypothetical protein
MSDDELKSMADSYERIGLLSPIVIFVDNSGEKRGEKGPLPKYLLAGRNLASRWTHRVSPGR